MDKWLIELSDNETKVVTTNELLAMEKQAEKFDGFYGWRVVKKLNEDEERNINIQTEQE